MMSRIANAMHAEPSSPETSAFVRASSNASVDQGVALSMESRRVMYGTNGAPASGRISNAGDCQVQARKAMLSSFTNMFKF